MRLLIATQAVDVDDPDLGFFLDWIRGFAAVFDQVSVICLFEGRHDLSPNVHIHSLGKEKKSRGALRYALRFLRLAWSLRHEYDSVLVHMNPEYLALGGALWRLSGKRTGLWYVHKRVNARLAFGALFANVIFTASPESFRLRSRKVRVLGHGIDVGAFQVTRREADDPSRIITIGRIARIKRIMEMILGVAECRARGEAASLRIVGAPVTADDRAYEKDIAATIVRLHLEDTVQMRGPVRHAEVSRELSSADVALNFSNTGSIDKAVLEALAAGVPVVTSNEAFARVPVVHYISEPDPASVCAAVRVARADDPQVLRAYVEEHHSLSRLVRSIAADLAS